ncbi:MAG: cytochrome P450 [Streptosporangiales bacterium]|nr:cytochrome P450 [Streptosporangiales bacterium]
MASADTYDPLAAEVIADPYPWYRELLAARQPVYVPGRDLWVISRYEHVRAAARDHGRLSSAEGIMYARVAMPMMITLDPPDHTRLRRLAAQAFTPRAIAELEDAVRHTADGLIDGLLGGHTDAVADLAGPLPVTLIAEMLGVPTADRARFRTWADRIVEGFNHIDDIDSYDEVDPAVYEAGTELHEYLSAVIAERRAAPADDLISRVITAPVEPEVTDGELFWFAFLLLIAGTETTTNLLGGMLHTLAGDPELRRTLTEAPVRLPDAIEESLRWHSPIQGFFRTATAPYAVDGVEIPAGSRVLLLYAAANRDPRHFPEPDVFDLDRRPGDHLAFGSGIHFCLGAHLARLETRVALERLLPRAGTLELAGEPARTANPTLRGFVKLPLHVPGR